MEQSLDGPRGQVHALAVVSQMQMLFAGTEVSLLNCFGLCSHICCDKPPDPRRDGQRVTWLPCRWPDFFFLEIHNAKTNFLHMYRLHQLTPQLTRGTCRETSWHHRISWHGQRYLDPLQKYAVAKGIRILTLFTEKCVLIMTDNRVWMSPFIYKTSICSIFCCILKVHYSYILP